MQLLEGLGIGGYRSFQNLVRIGPLAKVNLFVGGNNTGKSNILRFLHEHYHSAVRSIARNGEFPASSALDQPLWEPSAGSVFLRLPSTFGRGAPSDHRARSSGRPPRLVRTTDPAK